MNEEPSQKEKGRNSTSSVRSNHSNWSDSLSLSKKKKRRREKKKKIRASVGDLEKLGSTRSKDVAFVERYENFAPQDYSLAEKEGGRGTSHLNRRVTLSTRRRKESKRGLKNSALRRKYRAVEASTTLLVQSKRQGSGAMKTVYTISGHS